MQLSEKDFNCIKHPTFLKFVYKFFDNIFSDLLTNFSFNNKDYTIKVCSEITKYIDDINLYDDSELAKLFNSLVPLFNLNDKFQLLRFEYLIGFPTINIEEPSIKYPYPFFGYHKMSDEGSKIYQYRSLVSNRRSCCILRKLLSFKIREKTPCEFFISLLEACLENQSLLKFICSMQAEEPSYWRFIEWGNSIINKYQLKYETLSNFAEKMQKLTPLINDKFSTIINDTKSNILYDFTGFGKKNYLHKDIQQEIVSLITTNDNLYLYKIEYITSIIDFTADVNYHNSNSFVSGASILDEEVKKDVKIILIKKEF